MKNQASAMDDVDIYKLNLLREETFHYRGRVIRRGAEAVLVEAYFNRPDLDVHGILFATGDRFVEAYFADRWYNIFELHDRHNDHLKGWYCNICQPAEINLGSIAYMDMYLDLLVYPDGRQLVLDENEFSAAEMPAPWRASARQALAELMNLLAGERDFRLEHWFEINDENRVS